VTACTAISSAREPSSRHRQPDNDLTIQPYRSLIGLPIAATGYTLLLMRTSTAHSKSKPILGPTRGKQLLIRATSSTSSCWGDLEVPTSTPTETIAKALANNATSAVQQRQLSRKQGGGKFLKSGGDLECVRTNQSLEKSSIGRHARSPFCAMQSLAPRSSLQSQPRDTSLNLEIYCSLRLSNVYIEV
jgi:hypothetical protein